MGKWGSNLGTHQCGVLFLGEGFAADRGFAKIRYSEVLNGQKARIFRKQVIRTGYEKEQSTV